MDDHNTQILKLPTLPCILQFLEANKYAYCYTDMVHNHIATDSDHVKAMTTVPIGSVDYVFLEMKRCMLVDQCKQEIIEMRKTNTVETNRSMCDRCKIYYFHDRENGTHVCPQCGISFELYGEFQICDFFTRKRYNTNPIHHYIPHEHFFQTLLDITCTSRRRVPQHVMNFCRCVLGRGDAITNQNVFETLQSGGYNKYYASKYEIAARLRGKPEIYLTRRETEIVRMHYRRYARHMQQFQIEENLGNVSRRGKRRVYWPVRFIMAEMFKLIGRKDLVKHLRGISERSKAKKYDMYWKKLSTRVDAAEPVSRDVFKPDTMFPIATPTQTKKRKRT